MCPSTYRPNCFPAAMWGGRRMHEEAEVPVTSRITSGGSDAQFDVYHQTAPKLHVRVGEYQVAYQVTCVYVHIKSRACAHISSRTAQ